MPQAVVFDAGPLIYLDALGYLGGLGELYRVIIPGAVANELSRRPGASGSSAPALDFVERRTPATEDVSRVGEGAPAIDPGELEVIALAFGLGAVAVIDDRRGVRRASRLGVAVTGTLAVLIELHRNGFEQRSFTEDLEALGNAGMYLTDDLKERALMRLRESEEGGQR